MNNYARRDRERRIFLSSSTASSLYPLERIIDGCHRKSLMQQSQFSVVGGRRKMQKSTYSYSCAFERWDKFMKMYTDVFLIGGTRAQRNCKKKKRENEKNDNVIGIWNACGPLSSNPYNLYAFASWLRWPARLPLALHTFPSRLCRHQFLKLYIIFFPPSQYANREHTYAQRTHIYLYERSRYTLEKKHVIFFWVSEQKKKPWRPMESLLNSTAPYTQKKIIIIFRSAASHKL